MACEFSRIFGSETPLNVLQNIRNLQRLALEWLAYTIYMIDVQISRIKTLILANQGLLGRHLFLTDSLHIAGMRHQ